MTGNGTGTADKSSKQYWSKLKKNISTTQGYNHLTRINTFEVP
jgi:hypothetical protein